MSLILKQYVTVFIVYFVSLVSQSQDVTPEVILQKVEAHYKARNTFNYSMTYNMYRGYTGTDIVENYTGTIQKKGDVVLVHVLGNEVVQFPEHHIVLNKKEKTLVYTTNQQIQTAPVDISRFLQFYKIVKTKEEGGILVYELLLKDTPLPIPHKKIDLYINKNTLEIDKQILYLGTKVPFKDSNGAKVLDVGRIEIMVKPNTKDVMVKPKLEDYIELDASSKVRLAQNYKTYTLIDNRRNL